MCEMQNAPPLTPAPDITEITDTGEIGEIGEIEKELHRAVALLHPDVAEVCRYHLGWGSTGGTGKRIRAAMAALSAHSVGAPGSVAIAAGAAVELVHQFSLLHDDIMDGDRQRRGRDAAWVTFGTGAALLAGDALLVQAVSTIAAAPAPGTAAAIRRLLAALADTVNGQADDLALERRPAREVTAADYLGMARGKTGALLGCAAALGAALAGAPEDTTETLGRVGEALGVAFQITDDIIGLWGERATTGKPVGADLLRGKKTLPVLLAVGSGTAAGQRAADLLDSGGLDEHGLPGLLALLESAGARPHAEAAAAHHMHQATTALAEARLPPAAHHRWETLISRLTDRIH